MGSKSTRVFSPPRSDAPLQLKHDGLILTGKAYPTFLEPFLKLIDEVELLAIENSNRFTSHPKAKLFARIKRLVLRDSSRSKLARGSTRQYVR